MKSFLGFVISCVLIPAAYGGLVYWYVVQYGAKPPKHEPLTLAFLIALPLVVAGFPKWWDVWIIPPPKLGSPWRADSPAEFVANSLKWHTIAFVGCAVVHLAFNQGIAEEIFGTRLTLDVPQTQARLREVDEKLREARNRLSDAQERSAKSSFPVDDFGGFTADPFFADEEKRVAGIEVNRLAEEREHIRSQLEQHEAKVRRLQDKSKVPGDHYSPIAFGILWASAYGYSLLFNPVKKRFHSGQPIRRG